MARTRYVIVQGTPAELVSLLKRELPDGAPLPTRTYIGRGLTRTTPRLYSFEHEDAQWEVAIAAGVAVIRVEE